MAKPILRDDVYPRILQQILNGDIAPGAGLREERLAKALSVSRTPVREALRKLAGEGFVEYLPHRGARLLRPTRELASEVFLIREALEGVAAREAARCMEDAQRHALRSHFETLRPLVEAGNYSDVGDRIHSGMIAACGNGRLQQMFGILEGQIAWLQRVAVDIPDRPRRAFEEHLAILEALEQRNAKRAEAAARYHVRATLKDLLKSGPFCIQS